MAVVRLAAVDVPAGQAGAAASQAARQPFRVGYPRDSSGRLLPLANPIPAAVRLWRGAEPQARHEWTYVDEDGARGPLADGDNA